MKQIDPDTLKHGLELTDREKKIILIKFIIHGVSPFSGASLEKRVKMLAASAEALGFEYGDAEWQEIGRACLDVQQQLTDTLLSMISDNPKLTKEALKLASKGNEHITNVVGKDIIKEGLKSLKGKMKFD